MNQAQLRAAINNLETTQTGLAEMLDINPRTVRRLIAGDPMRLETDLAIRFLLVDSGCDMPPED